MRIPATGRAATPTGQNLGRYMRPQEARNRLIQLHHVGEANSLTVYGFLEGHTALIVHDFSAGKVEIEPPFANAKDDGVDHRLIYTSWDGERSRDLTDLTDAAFVAFMRSEPAGLIERAY